MVENILKKYEPKQENLLFILHDLQDAEEQNYLKADSLKKVAEYLDISLSQIHGVISFYTMFSVKPRGKYVIRICESAPCHLMGAASLKEHLRQTLKVDFGETTKDGLFTLETSACLGVCGVAPAMMINEEVYGNLTPKKIDDVIGKLRSSK